MTSDNNQQDLWGINSNTDQLKDQVIEITKSLDDLQKRQKDLIAAGEKTGKTYQDVAAQIRVAKKHSKKPQPR